MEKVQEFVLKYKFILLAILLLFIITGIFLLTGKKPQESVKEKVESGQNLQLSQPNSQSDNGGSPSQQAGNGFKRQSFIYFTQSSPDSSVDVYKSDGADTSFVARLPSDIRAVTPLGDGDLVYVSGLGFLDRGESIERYFHALQKNSTAVTASSGFQIENYIITDSQDAVIFWEVEINKSTQGKSHVVYQSLANPTNRIILVSEDLSDQTKYPVLYLPLRNSVILDSYSVNRKGLYQGLFEVNLTDGSIKEILAADAYSQVPVASQDGSQLIFSSYNNSATIQLAAPSVANGLFRSVIRNPNEIKILDLASMQVKTVVPLADGFLYTNLTNPTGGSSVYYQKARIDGKELKPIDTESVDVATDTISTLFDRPDGQVVGVFQNKYIIGFGTGTLMNLGGMDQSYSQIYNGVYLYDPSTQKYEKILSDGDVSIIGVK